MAEDKESRFKNIVNKSFQATRDEMELRTLVGEFKKEVRKANDSLFLAGVLIDSHIPVQEDFAELKLKELLGIRNDMPIDFEKLQKGWKAYGFGTGSDSPGLSDEEKGAREYLRQIVVKPILEKYKTSEVELNKYTSLEVGTTKARMDAELKKAWTSLSKRKKN